MARTLTEADLARPVLDVLADLGLYTPEMERILDDIGVNKLADLSHLEVGLMSHCTPLTATGRGS